MLGRIILIGCVWLLAARQASIAEAFVFCGFNVSPIPSVTDRFLRCQTAVVGEVTYVAPVMTVWHPDDDTQRDESPSLLYRFQVRVYETLYGKPVGDVVTVDWEHDSERQNLFWRPYRGAKAIVFIGGSPSPLGDVAGVVYAWRVADFDHPEVDAIRRIGRILMEPNLDEQIRLAIEGSFGTNRPYQTWCLRAIASDYEFGESLFGVRNPIHSRLGGDRAREVLRQVCFSRQHDLATLELLDRLMANDARYAASERRYESFWLAAHRHAPSQSAHDEGVPTGRTNAFLNFAVRINAAFPKRADDTILRMLRLVQDERAAKETRIEAFRSIGFLTEWTSLAVRAEVLEHLVYYLDDAEFGPPAATTIHRFAMAEMREPIGLLPRLNRLVRAVDLYKDKDVVLRLRTMAQDLSNHPSASSNPFGTAALPELK